ncbi:Alpha/Beta hydrolase protein [Desarmillaria tabescens]|uniref:Alpha/Beta hydrolase protein n=1 Tax=Armillaria tabescens TaxID=1929756 RepID=A0AA39MP05_ARMTA|nr:Alpha/Beta hydrolase protein [Desarmillaria tabescens]KAK0441781.1 Alpha/Beta hydrolase protein [Desarmillaria tabescens]
MSFVVTPTPQTRQTFALQHPRSSPIPVFSHGGGFYMGTHTLPDPASIIYHTLGSFFATRGFITIAPDYRLVDSGVKFPGAAQDVRDAMQWVVDNLPFPDSDIYVLGHSAGAMNLITIPALPELYSPTLQPRITGAVLLYMKDSVRLYYGEDDEAKQRMSVALLGSARLSAPRLLLGIDKRNISCLRPIMERFGGALSARSDAGWLGLGCQSAIFTCMQPKDTEGLRMHAHRNPRLLSWRRLQHYPLSESITTSAPSSPPADSPPSFPITASSTLSQWV